MVIACQTACVHSSGAWFDADVVVYRAANALLASQVALRGLDRNVPKQELDLLKLSARSLAQASAAATIMPRSA